MHHFASTLTTQIEKKNQNEINYYIISKRVQNVLQQWYILNNGRSMKF